MWPAPNGLADKQYEESLAKSKRFSQGVVLKAPILTRLKATTAYWTMYISSVTFGIGLTLMDLDQLDNIQKPLMHAILPKMGYSSKTCRHVVFGPRIYYLGIRARDLFLMRQQIITQTNPKNYLSILGGQPVTLPCLGLRSREQYRRYHCDNWNFVQLLPTC